MSWAQWLLLVGMAVDRMDMMSAIGQQSILFNRFR